MVLQAISQAILKAARQAKELFWHRTELQGVLVKCWEHTGKAQGHVGNVLFRSTTYYTPKALVMICLCHCPERPGLPRFRDVWVFLSSVLNLLTTFVCKHRCTLDKSTWDVWHGMCHVLHSFFSPHFLCLGDCGCGGCRCPPRADFGRTRWQVLPPSTGAPVLRPGNNFQEQILRPRKRSECGAVAEAVKVNDSKGNRTGLFCWKGCWFDFSWFFRRIQ